MALRVKPMVQYLTAEVENIRSKDYTALQIAKAVKGRDPGGIDKSVSLEGITYNFGPNNPQGAVDLWTAWASRFVRGSLEHPDEALVLVPVPNSHAVVGTNDSFRTLELAQYIAASVGGNVTAQDELRWTEEMFPANQGGTRWAHQLYPKLVYTQKCPIDAERVLIDDVLTGGGHLQASARRLRENCLTVEGGIVCGRTTHVQISNPYSVPVEELPDFDPDDPFGCGALAADF